MKVFVKMIHIPKYFLFPFIILCCVMGVYALNNRSFDIWVLIVFGIIGYLLAQAKVPLSPVIMGYLMGATFERNFRRALIGSGGSFGELFLRPIAVVFVIAALLFVLAPFFLSWKKAHTQQPEAS